MNNTLKWREAATLILAAGSQHRHIVSKLQSPAQPHSLKRTAFDYNVLLLQRSQKSGFMPNAYVFPGGLVDPSDFSNDWVKVFEKYRHQPNFGLGLVKQNPTTRAPMFATDRTRFGSLIPGEVAFRICAIRETFEESGILLVVPEGSDAEASKNAMAVFEENQKLLAKWREDVQGDPFQFIEMCKEMRCVPNIWALHEWSNWLTPKISRSSNVRRYDTAFFICCLQKRPPTTQDQKEVVSFTWWSPFEAIQEYLSQKIFIPPPQCYELSRMCNLPRVQELHRFSLARALEGCEQWMTVLVKAEDGVMHTLPGDDLYPDDVDSTAENPKLHSTNKNIEDLLRDGGRHHRLLYHDGVPNLYVNVEQKYKHLGPVAMNAHSAEPKSKM